MDSVDDIMDIVHELVFTTSMFKINTPKFKKWLLYSQGLYMVLSILRLYYLLVYKKEMSITKSTRFLIIFEAFNLMIFMYRLQNNLKEIDILHNKQSITTDGKKIQKKTTKEILNKSKKKQQNVTPKLIKYK